MKAILSHRTDEVWKEELNPSNFPPTNLSNEEVNKMKGKEVEVEMDEGEKFDPNDIYCFEYEGVRYETFGDCFDDVTKKPNQVKIIL